MKLDTIPVVMQFCSTRRASCCGADTQFGSLPQPGWRCVSLSEQERLGPTLVTDSTEISVYQKCLYKETLYMNWNWECSCLWPTMKQTQKPVVNSPCKQMTYSQLLVERFLCVMRAHSSPRPKTSGRGSARQCKYLGSPVAQWKI